MEKLILKGKVKSGKGDFAQWIQLFHDYYFRKTGLHLFPGTLNIELSQPYSLPPDAIRLEKEEYGGRVSVSMQPCTIRGHKAFILRTDLNASGKGDHPLNIIEVATDIGLRDTYSLQDGDEISVIIE